MIINVVGFFSFLPDFSSNACTFELIPIRILTVSCQLGIFFNAKDISFNFILFFIWIRQNVQHVCSIHVHWHAYCVYETDVHISCFFSHSFALCARFSFLRNGMKTITHQINKITLAVRFTPSIHTSFDY